MCLIDSNCCRLIRNCCKTQCWGLFFWSLSEVRCAAAAATIERLVIRYRHFIYKIARVVVLVGFTVGSCVDVYTDRRKRKDLWSVKA